MVGYFRHNQIYKVKVDGNAQSVYWVRDEKKQLIGVNKAESSYMVIRVKNNEIKAINYVEQASETMYPENELPPQERILKGFLWMGQFRPRSKFDIFRKNQE